MIDEEYKSPEAYITTWSTSYSALTALLTATLTAVRPGSYVGVASFEDPGAGEQSDNHHAERASLRYAALPLLGSTNHSGQTIVELKILKVICVR